MTDQFPSVGNPLRLSDRRIITIADSLSRSFADLHGDVSKNLFCTTFDVVYDTLIYPRYGVFLEEGDDLGFDIDGEKVLGYFDASTNTISLDRVLCDRNNPLHFKRTFTAWHELGHALLHGKWVRNNPGRYASGQLVTVESSISPGAIERLERQANLFAAHGAAPTWFLDWVLRSTFELTRPIRFSGPGVYQIEPWGCPRRRYVGSFEELCKVIGYPIQHRFGGLSIESLSYRIQETRWVVDATRESISRPATLFRTAAFEEARIPVEV